MSATWAILTTEDVLSQFTIAEASAIRALQGSGSGSGFPFLNIDEKVVHVTDEVRGYISAGGYELDETSDPRTIPLSLFEDAIAIARWRLLIALPGFKQLQTEERRQAFEDALKKLALIAAQKFQIVPPVPSPLSTAGMWNSENKIIMRSHPIPRPGSQFIPQTNTYANPDAPVDSSMTQTSGTLTVGTVYRIVLYISPDDFENVGGTNTTGSIFSATGTTPTVWTNSSQLQSQ